MEHALVPVKSPWASTVNWAAFGSMIVGVGAMFNLPLDATSVNTVLAALPVAFGAFTWVKNTWFSKRVLSSSLPSPTAPVVN